MLELLVLGWMFSTFVLVLCTFKLSKKKTEYIVIREKIKLSKEELKKHMGE